MLDGDKVPVFSLSWDEGRLFDLWMIVHFLTGLVIGFSAFLIGLESTLSYLGTLAGLALYEVVEEIFNIDETIENRVADIVFGMVGFVISYTFITSAVDVQTSFLLLAVAVLVVMICAFLGWRAYKKRVS